MTLQAAKMLLAFANTEGLSIQVTTGIRRDEITIDCASEDILNKLLEYANNTQSARRVEISLGSQVKYRLV